MLLQELNDLNNRIGELDNRINEFEGRNFTPTELAQFDALPESERYTAKDKALREKVENGELSQADYEQWKAWNAERAEKKLELKEKQKELSTDVAELSRQGRVIDSNDTNHELLGQYTDLVHAACRPGLDDMIATLEEGDMVVVFKLDRLGRSVLNLDDLLVRFRNDGVHFCSICEGINTNTPGGKLVYHIFSAVSEFGRDLIVENTIEGLNAARRRGTRLGRPRKLDDQAILSAHRMHFAHGVSVAEMAQRLNVAPATLRRGFGRFDLRSYPVSQRR